MSDAPVRPNVGPQCSSCRNSGEHPYGCPCAQHFTCVRTHARNDGHTQAFCAATATMSEQVCACGRGACTHASATYKTMAATLLLCFVTSLRMPKQRSFCVCKSAHAHGPAPTYCVPEGPALTGAHGRPPALPPTLAARMRPSGRTLWCRHPWSVLWAAASPAPRRRRLKSTSVQVDTHTHTHAMRSKGRRRPSRRPAAQLATIQDLGARFFRTRTERGGAGRRSHRGRLSLARGRRHKTSNGQILKVVALRVQDGPATPCKLGLLCPNHTIIRAFQLAAAQRALPRDANCPGRFSA